jgi:hypothetical protein
VALSGKKWSPISWHHVVLAWLRAERRNQQLSQWPQAALSAVLDAPDLSDLEQNRMRQYLLLYRTVFISEIPPDTTWFEVRNLTHGDIAELRAVNFESWSDHADANELIKVAARKPIELANEPSSWDSPILWGHSKAGPFTIFEGNHRLTAYAGSGRTDLDIPVLIGLSTSKCHWHLPDHYPHPLDLFKKRGLIR